VEGHLVLVATEAGNVLLHPSKRQQLVLDAWTPLLESMIGMIDYAPNWPSMPAPVLRNPSAPRRYDTVTTTYKVVKLGRPAR
jgi:hypothetical protein